MSKQWDKDDLLVDLEQSIDRALKERMTELAGALYRLQGSAKNWCDDPSCGECPLAEKGCITNINSRVKRLIAEYHGELEKQSTEEIARQADKAVMKLAHGPEAEINRGARHISRLMGDRAHDFVAYKVRSLDPQEDKDALHYWSRVRTVLTRSTLYESNPSNDTDKR